jgi:bifunctional non-homologous end joining protein LigD
MLATRDDHAFSDPMWLFEPKWDGIRLMYECDGSSVTLRTRTGRSVKYPGLDEPLTDRALVLDGELVALDERGAPSFELLQRGGASIAYMVFDVLYDAVEVIAEPLEERLARLAAIAMPAPFVRSETVGGEGEALFTAIKEQGLEGMVAKRLGSSYRPGIRSPDWRKIVVRRSVRAVVGGFTRGEGSRASTFGALLVGLWVGSNLRWIGAVGTGFSDAALASVRSALEEMRTDRCPFEADDELPRDASWVVPHLVAAVEYREWTEAGRLRGPSFKGFAGEPPEAATWEAEGPEA